MKAPQQVVGGSVGGGGRHRARWESRRPSPSYSSLKSAFQRAVTLVLCLRWRLLSLSVYVSVCVCVCSERGPTVILAIFVCPPPFPFLLCHARVQCRSSSGFLVQQLIMRRACPTTLVTTSLSLRSYSKVGASQSPFPWAEDAPAYPSVRSAYPLPRPRFRKTHIEWMLHHGHGDRHSKYGPSREIPDFEFEDGTPAPATPRRFAFKHHQDHLLVQLIRAGATVERYEREGMLPRIPGTREQRDWDPSIPLFLEDLDERGRQPEPLPAQDMVERVVDERYSGASHTPSNLANRHAGEELEPNTMFASYDPAAFVSDDVRMDVRRPYWSRRRWALSDNFMVPVSPKPKNTIPDEK